MQRLPPFTKVGIDSLSAPQGGDPVKLLIPVRQEPIGYVRI